MPAPLLADRDQIDLLLERVYVRLAQRRAAQDGLTTPLWKPLAGPQTEAYHSAADELFYGGQAGGGKALALDTPLPTPTGWTTMGEVVAGDLLLDEQGWPCRVVATSNVMYERPCYELVFDDGATIVADAEHRWVTLTAADRLQILRCTAEWRAARRDRRPSRGLGKRPDLAARNTARALAVLPRLPSSGAIRTTVEMAASYRVGARANHSIPLASPLALPTVMLPVAPYTLGAWLGDGNTWQGMITVHPDDAAILRRIEADGYAVHHVPSAPLGWTILGVQPYLRAIGVLGQKRIPLLYLRASHEQRLALLQGLMDTDGCCDVDGGAEYTTILPGLARGVVELSRTLGLKPTLTVGRAMLGDRDCGPKYRVKVTTSAPLFALARKAARQVAMTRATQCQRYVTDVRPVSSVPVRCVTVDSPSHLYLAGEALVPTHNSDLLLGLALTAHRKAIVFRREYPQLRDLIERSREIVGAVGRFNANASLWRLDDGRTLEFGAAQYEADVSRFQGRPHDLVSFDEVAHFTETQYRFLIGWNRTTTVGQRTRIVAAGNPPTSTEGEWVIRHWAPWLDAHHPNPAQPGELRWFAMIDKAEVEVAGPDPFEHKGETITPRSRTFIPASLSDNPYLMATDYGAVLQALPEPLRSQLLYGDFTVGTDDDPWQVIPTAWVRAAMARWTPDGRPRLANGKPAPLDAVGVDVARGGKDKTVLSRRYGRWYAELEKHPGTATPDGPSVARLVLAALAEGGCANVDGIGVGASVYDLLRQQDAQVESIIFGAQAPGRDRSDTLSMVNYRAWAYWSLRDSLDPERGDNIALPPDPQLLADLCVARWTMRVSGVQVEPKEDIAKRIGRSPDCADAVVLAGIVQPRLNIRWM